MAAAKNRSAEKDLTQRARRAEHRGRREERFLTAHACHFAGSEAAGENRPAPFGMTCVVGSAGWGIGDFTENCRAARAGGGGNVAGAVVKSLVRQQGKSESFFCVFGYAELRGWNDLDLRKGGSNLPHDERVVGAAAGDDELMDFGFWQDEAV